MSEHDPRQGSLFEIEDSTFYSPTTEPASHEARTDSSIKPVVDGVYPEYETADRLVDKNPGPHVSILERNRELGRVINKLASISRAEGFKKADTIPGLRDEIVGRYATGYEEVRENTVSKSERVAIEVPENFAKAWGLEQVTANISDSISIHKIEEAMAEEYRQFDAWFGGSGGGVKRRDAIRRWLNYQERKLTDQRTRRPNVEYPRHPRSR